MANKADVAASGHWLAILSASLYFIVKHLVLALCYSGVFVLATYFGLYVLRPIQDGLDFWMFPGHDELIVTIPCFSFGVRIIAAYVEGWKSVLYLAPGSLMLQLNGYSMGLGEKHTEAILFLILLVPPLVFSVLDWENRVCRTASNPSQAWRTLFLGGLVSVIITSHFFHLSYTDEAGSVMTPVEELMFGIGGMLGLFLLLYLSLVVMRWFEEEP